MDLVILLIILLLIFICYLLLDIRSRLPERDYVKEALERDRIRKESKEKEQDIDL